MRNIWEHVTHPHSHNPLFRLWGHASKSRQLPHSGKAFRQHLLPLQFMRNASQTSRTTGVSSVKSARNVAVASNSCVPKTRFARRNPCSIFRQLPFWLSAFRRIRTGMRENWTSTRATAEGTLKSVTGCNRTPQCSRLASRLRSHSIKMIQVPGSCESNVEGALDTTRSPRLLSTVTLSGVSKSGGATLFAGSSRISEKGWEPCHRRGDAQFGDRV